MRSVTTSPRLVPFHFAPMKLRRWAATLLSLAPPRHHLAARCLFAGLTLGSVASAADTARSLPPAPDSAWVKRLFDGWRAPVPPRKLVGTIHYVGASGVSSFLITTPAGHILLDTGFDDTVPIIQQSVEQLGLRLADIKFILSSHAHIDHVAGHARMKQLTGAQIVASSADARTIESGGEDDYIKWPKETILYAPAKVDRVIKDGERVTLGGVTLTAHLTPGHTRGATTWTMQVEDRGATRHVVFFSSASINAGTRLVNNPLYPDFVRDFEATFAKLHALPCDIFFAPHGGQFAMAEKFARLDRGQAENPFVDPAGWKRLITGAEKAFRDQFAVERAAAK
jgi:metallo-beta-lactamase class B